MPAKGLQILHHSVVNATVGSLASLASLAIDGADYAGSNLTAGFLIKKLQGMVIVEGLSSAASNDDIPILCLVDGDADVSESAAAMVVEQPDPAVDTLIDQATVRRIRGVLMPTLIQQNENDANAADVTLIYDLSKMDLPRGGIPFSEGKGWTWHIFNFTGAAFTTGGTAHFWARYFGVWLSD